MASVKKQYEFIKESNLYGFADDCFSEFEETGKMPVVDDEELGECDVCNLSNGIVLCNI